MDEQDAASSHAVDPVQGDGWTPGTHLTIDELAGVVGMSVRNIRAHHSRGLLPPAVIRGRQGRYGERHVARLRLILAMQELGFSLDVIRLFVDDPVTYGQLLATMRRAMTQRHVAVDWIELSPERLETLRSLDPNLPEVFVQAGAFRTGGNTGYLCHPSIIDAGAALTERGLGMVHLTNVQLEVFQAAERVASRIASDVVPQAQPRYDAERPADVADEVQRFAVQLFTTGFELALTSAVRRAATPGPPP
jgi:DNA-binding transcriptional MerR regulator